MQNTAIDIRPNGFQFTFKNLEAYYKRVLDLGYEILTCRDYVQYKKSKQKHKILVNRIDIDVSVKKAHKIVDILNKLNIKASFFIRLHANEYNPFSFENYRILKYIRDCNHEIGYHSEVIDQSYIWEEDSLKCLTRDLKVLETMFDIKIDGIASHGGLTGLNNLSFWKDKKPSDFHLLYEAYDTEPMFDLFNNSLYVSDSCWTYWKSYYNGKHINNDQRNFAEHAIDNHQVIYLLIHPETYYENHFYE